MWTFASAAVDPFDAHCIDIVVLEDHGVQTDIGITQAQRDKLNGFAKIHQQKLMALDKDMKEKHIDPRPKLPALYAELKGKVLTILTPAQSRRLREITLQRLGLASLCDDEVAKRVPVGRIGQTEDMAGAAIYLASRAGDYVVGDTIVVDGGVTTARG